MPWTPPPKAFSKPPDPVQNTPRSVLAAPHGSRDPTARRKIIGPRRRSPQARSEPHPKSPWSRSELERLLEAVAGPRLDDEELGAWVALLDDLLRVLVLAHLHRLGDAEALEGHELIEERHLVQELDALRHVLLPRRHHDLAKRVAVQRPQHAVLRAAHRGEAGLPMEERELAERPPGAVLEYLDLGVLALLDEHVRVPRVKNVVVVAILALLDDVVVLGARLLLEGADDGDPRLLVEVGEQRSLLDVLLKPLALVLGLLVRGWHPIVIQLHSLHEHVGAAAPRLWLGLLLLLLRLLSLLLLGLLDRGRRRLSGLGDGTSILRQLHGGVGAHVAPQDLEEVPAQAHEGVAPDDQDRHLPHGLDGGLARFPTEECDLPKEVARVEAVHLAPVDKHLHGPAVDEVHALAHLPSLDDSRPRLDLDCLEGLRDLLQARRVDVVENGELADEQERPVGAVQLLG
mmetsp:Transcript_65939/g.162280  ORF Transcript_65939/g.162280 Transcript_65939/m.162280 type:complete len:459 (-) Transcript_65939:950-2326(-)